MASRKSHSNRDFYGSMFHEKSKPRQVPQPAPESMQSVQARLETPSPTLGNLWTQDQENLARDLAAGGSKKRPKGSK